MKASLRRSIIIGLGGTGILTVLQAKKSLYQYYGDIPPCVRFLVFDTDRYKKDQFFIRVQTLEGMKLLNLEPHEFVYLDVKNPLDLVKMSPSIASWFPDTLPVKAIIDGAGAIRAVGRLALHAHANDVVKSLSNLIDPLRDLKLGENMEKQGFSLLPGEDIDIYIVGSLAGGTGSGCFLDIAFLMRFLTRGQVTRNYAFLILPWIFRGLPATHRANSNTYSALKELDYYMSVDYKKETFQFKFGTETILIEKPPFDVVNLIDGRNENNENVKGAGGAEGIKNLCWIVGSSIGLNIGAIGTQNQSALSNLAVLLGIQTPADWGGKNAFYSSFGTSSIIYPVEKHYSRCWGEYASLLLDDAIRKIRKEDKDISEDVQKDVLSFVTEASLNDQNDNIIDSLIRPDDVDTSPLIPEGVSENELDDWWKREISDFENRVSEKIEKNLEIKKEEGRTAIREAIKLREQKTLLYSLKFTETISHQMKMYRERRVEEINELENERKNAQDYGKKILEEIKELKSIQILMGKKKELKKDLRNQLSTVLKITLEIMRRRKSLEIFDILIEEAKNYISKMDISAIERKLSEIRGRISSEIFRSTYLGQYYGEYTIIKEPHSALVPVQEKEKKSITSWKSIDEFARDMRFPVDWDSFLKEVGLSYSDIEKLDKEEIRKILENFCSEKMSLLKNINIEEVLLKDVEKENEEEEKLLSALREASSRATPFWYHKAMAEMGARMEEVFILGVSDIEKTKLKKDGIIQELSKGKDHLKPTFTTTKDPYKLFFFKYKAPLPLYLLQDMDIYREEYFATPVVFTSHIEKDMELRIPDIFPFTEVDKFNTRVFALSVSPVFNLIKIKKEERMNEFVNVFYIDDPRLIPSGEREIVIGESRMLAHQEFKKSGRKELKEKIVNALKEELSSKNPSEIEDALKRYLSETEEILKREFSKLTIGERILLNLEINAIKDFLNLNMNIEKFLH